jgi:hypothetical protein
MAAETIAIFEGLELTADGARRAIRAHTGADVVWEWHDSKDDTVERADSVAVAQGGATYHAGVAAQGEDEAPRQMVRHAATPRDALADLLWDVVLDTMLAEDATARPLGATRDEGRDGAKDGPRQRRVVAVRVRRPSQGPATASCR